MMTQMIAFFKKDSLALISRCSFGELQFYRLLDLGTDKPYDSLFLAIVLIAPGFLNAKPSI